MALSGHVLAARERDSRPVIEIWLDTTQPLAGRVVLRDGRPHPFAGWLQLLGILADAFASEPPAAEARSGS